MTAIITKHGVRFSLPELSITFDRARSCLVVEGQGESSEASTGTSYPFSLIDAIQVAPISDRVCKLTIVFQRGDRLALCRVERELATRLAWVLGELTRAAVDLETADAAPLGPSVEPGPFGDLAGPLGQSVVTRLLDRRGPDTQETPRTELFDDDDLIPEIDPGEVIELVSTPVARAPMPRAGTPRVRTASAPARPRRSSVRDTNPDMRSPLLRFDSGTGGSQS